MHRKAKPNLKLLKKCYKYNPSTGYFYHKRNFGRCVRGTRAGGLNPDGYRSISVGSIKYLEHHIAWLYYYGEWPKELDHKNRHKDQNHIKNLRKATRADNNRNVERASRCVCKVGRRYRARITVNYKNIHLGYFNSSMEAEKAYEKAAKKYFGVFHAC